MNVQEELLHDPRVSIGGGGGGISKTEFLCDGQGAVRQAILCADRCCFLSSQKDQLLKERICSSWSKFFPLRVVPFWMGFVAQGSKQKGTKDVFL